MAKVVNLWLKANGNDVAGEPETLGPGDCFADSIECLAFMDDVSTARERGSAMATGERRFSPLRIRKRVDMATPLIQKALSNNEVVEGKFQFWRPAPAGDGTNQHYFTIEFTGGRVDSIQRTNPDVFDPAAANEPFTEWVAFVFEQITWTYEVSGASHTDSWRASR